MNNNLDTAKRYLAALEQGGDCQVLREFLDPQITQQEFPNRLTPAGASRDLAALLASCERGQQVITAQHFDIKNSLASGNQVALEVVWTGELAVALGSLAPGSRMQAHFAVFMEFRAGRIVAQRNYDCFEPW